MSVSNENVNQITIKKTVDARDSYDIGPYMELLRAMKYAQPGDVIELIFNNPAEEEGILQWINKCNQKLLEVKRQGKEIRMLIQRTEIPHRRKKECFTK